MTSAGRVIQHLSCTPSEETAFLVSTGNAFPTREAAQAHLAKLIAIGEVNDIIEELNGDWVPSEDDAGYQLEFDHDAYTSPLEFEDACYDAARPFTLVKRDMRKALKERITAAQIKVIWGK